MRTSPFSYTPLSDPQQRYLSMKKRFAKVIFIKEQFFLIGPKNTDFGKKNFFLDRIWKLLADLIYACQSTHNDNFYYFLRFSFAFLFFLFFSSPYFFSSRSSRKNFLLIHSFILSRATSSNGQIYTTTLAFTTTIPAGAVVTHTSVVPASGSNKSNTGAIVGGAIGGQYFSYPFLPLSFILPRNSYLLLII